MMRIINALVWIALLTLSFIPVYKDAKYNDWEILDLNAYSISWISVVLVVSFTLLLLWTTDLYGLR